MPLRLLWTPAKDRSNAAVTDVAAVFIAFLSFFFRLPKFFYQQSYAQSENLDFTRFSHSYPHYPHFYTHFFRVEYVDFFRSYTLDIIRQIL